MADYSAHPVPDPTAPKGGLRLDPKHGALGDAGGGGATITYCYRESGGTRGTTTSLSSVPVGAEIERTVTQ
ncbi:MAG: hypothetical protein R3A48_12860 [Polyangiales bacterium]